MDILREEFGVEAELSKGQYGIFEVRVNGQVVAKKTFDGFPDEAEIVRAVARAQGG